MEPRNRSQPLRPLATVLDAAESAWLSTLPAGPYLFSDVRHPERLREHNHRLIDEGDLAFARLRDSILISGIREPIQLSFHPRSQQLTILAGHRRVRCVLELRKWGHSVILPALVTVATPEETDQERLIRASAVAVTNLASLRQDLRGVEKARAIAQFMEDSGIRSISSAARVLGVDRKSVERSLNLLKLPEELQQAMLERADRISERQAWDLASEYKAMLKAGVTPDDATCRLRIHILAAAAGARQRVIRSSRIHIDLNKLEQNLTQRNLAPTTIAEVLSAIQDLSQTKPQDQDAKGSGGSRDP